MTTLMSITQFRQTTPYTCGPACVAIALEYFSLGRADRSTEDEIYRDCREVHESQPIPHHNGHVSHPELARYWLQRGHQARQRHRDPGLISPDLIDQRLKRYLAVEQEAVRKGLELILEEPTEDVIAADLADGWVAVPRVHFGDEPHNQLVYRADNGVFHAACPVLGPVRYRAGQLAASMQFPTARSVLLLKP